MCSSDLCPRGGEYIGALVERRLPHRVHLLIDLGACRIEFLIVFSRSGRGFLRRGIGKFLRTAHRMGALIDDAKNRLEDQRVEQVGAQQQEADDPKCCDIRR